MFVPAMHSEFSEDVKVFARRLAFAHADADSAASKSVTFQTRLAVICLFMAVCSSFATPVVGWLLQQPLLAGLAVLLALVEAAFFLYARKRHAAANELANEPPPADPALPSLTQRWLLEGDLPLDQFISGWFHGAKLDTIKRGNVEEFLAYGLFYSRLEDLTPSQVAASASILARLEARLGRTFAPGYNASAKYMAHLWQPLRTVHLPLLAYVVTEALGLVASGALWAAGFQRRATPCGFAYWIRPRSGGAGGAAGRKEGHARAPLLFLHGVLGLVGCLPFLWGLVRTRGSAHALIVLDIRHVSLRLSPAGARTADQVATAAAAALAAEGASCAHVVAHSYGTFVVARLMRRYGASLVASAALLEPVALLTCWPTLLGTFVYGCCGGVPTSVKQAVQLLRWMCSRELTMAQTFCRRFYWSELTLWPCQLPAHTLAVVSAGDDLVASDHVTTLLTAAGTGRVLRRQGGGHGDVLLNPKWMAQVVGEVDALVERAEAARAAA